MFPQKILITGMPGSGKGTQAKKLLVEHHLNYLSTGEMFREQMVKNTPLGQQIRHLMDTGQYVNDDITNEIVKDYISQPSYFLDGYPRTLNQANFLDALNPPDVVLMLEVDEDTVINRILKRGETSGRPEDLTVDIIHTRINLYFETMKPVIIHYSAQQKLVVVSANNDEETVYQDIKNALERV